MKRSIPAIAFLLGACLVGFALSRPAVALNQSLSELKDMAIACSASTVTPILAAAPQGTTRADSMYIANTSATCVRVGGSAVTSTTGASIGSGCRDGAGITMDVKKAYCLSTSGTVTVDVIYGVQ